MKPCSPHPTYFVPQIVFLSFKDTVDREKESWGLTSLDKSISSLQMKCCLQFFLADTCSKNYATSLSSNPHTSQRHSLSSSMPLSALTPSQFSAHPNVPTEHAHWSDPPGTFPKNMETGACALDSKAASVTNWLCDPVRKLLETLYHSVLVCGRKTCLVFHRVTLWIKWDNVPKALGTVPGT